MTFGITCTSNQALEPAYEGETLEVVTAGQLLLLLLGSSILGEIHGGDR